MDFIHKQAISFKNKFFQGSQALKESKRLLQERILIFNRVKDQIEFMSIVRHELNKQKIEHERDCKLKPCSTSESLDNAIFILDQEIEETYKNYEPQTFDEDYISTKLRIDLINNINDVLNKLEKLEHGQEIIFSEIEELKEHFSLGKKKWLQLLKGKIVDLGFDYGVEKIILDTLYESIIKGLDKSSISFINNL